MMAGYVAFTGTDELAGCLLYVYLFIARSIAGKCLLIFRSARTIKKSGQKANYFLDERAFLK